MFREGGVAAVADVAKQAGSERLARILPEAIQAIHEVIRKHRVTEEEWSAVLEFFTQVSKQDEFVLLSDVTKTSVLVDTITHEDESGVTPSDVEGPLYREDPPWREKPVKLYEEYEGVENGDVLFVQGKVTSTDGAPISGAVLDIWQTGPDGGYDLWDERQPDYNFRGRFGVDEDGAYEFQTMVPKPYTVRTGQWVSCWRPSASTPGVQRTYTSKWRRRATSRSSRRSSSQTISTWRTTP